jgi:hypothetical protein
VWREDIANVVLKLPLWDRNRVCNEGRKESQGSSVLSGKVIHLSLQYPKTGGGSRAALGQAHGVKQHKHSCAAGATHIRGIPALRRVEPSSTYTNSLRQHALAPNTLSCPHPEPLTQQLLRGAPDTFTASFSKGHVWRSKSGTLFIPHTDSSRPELFCAQHGQETRGRRRRGAD